MVDRTYQISGRGALFDDLLVLKAKGTVATAMVGEDPVGTDKYVDVGNGHTRGDMVVNVYGTGLVAAGMWWKMNLQGGLNSSFSTVRDLVEFTMGDAIVVTGGVDFGVGRYILPFTNELDGVTYRYLRHFIFQCISATMSTGIQYEIYLSKIKH